MSPEEQQPSIPQRPELRERAEELLRTTRTDVAEMPKEDVQRLVHELQVHQIELELQNEELRQAQVELAESRDRYSDLYEFAPVGYLALDRDGEIREANLAAATMLGVERRELPGAKVSGFVGRESQDTFYLHRKEVLASEEKQVCEIGMRTAKGKLMAVRLESVVFGPEDDRCFRTALIDVTERKEAEMALRMLNVDLGQSLEESMGELRDRLGEVRLLTEAVSNLGEGVMITGSGLDWPGAEILFVNDAMCRITGYTRDELFGRTPGALQEVGIDQEALDRTKTELAAGRSCMVELTNYRKCGASYEVELFITPLVDSEGQRSNFVMIHRDISARKRTEGELRESEERFRHVFEHAATGIAVTDWEGQLEYCNPAYCALLGYTEEEYRRINFSALIHPDDRDANLAEVRRLKTGEVHSFEIENRYMHKDGRPVWVRKFVSNLPDEAGRPGRLMALVTDVTAGRHAAKQLREREERLLAIMSAAPDGIITIDHEGVIAATNPSAERIFGYAAGELTGQNVETLFPSLQGGRIDGYHKHLHRIGEGAMAGMGREVAGCRKDGSAFDADLSVREVRSLGLFTGVIRDITSRKLLEQEVVNAAEEERQRIAHDLHDDLGSLLTGIKLATEAQAGAMARSGSGDAGKCSAIAQQVCEAIAKTRNIARGLRPVGSDPEDLMDALRGLSRQTEEATNLRCRFECIDSVVLDEPVVANHLFRIAQEAVNNAVKYSGGTGITISLRRRDGAVELRVDDDGSGFDPGGERSSGLGIHIMSYRAHAVNASLRFEQRERGGTSVVCSVQ